MFVFRSDSRLSTVPINKTVTILNSLQDFKDFLMAHRRHSVQSNLQRTINGQHKEEEYLRYREYCYEFDCA